MKTFSIKTSKRNELIDITEAVAGEISASKVANGIAVVYVRHTTAGVTINENADPDVPADLLMMLEELVPHRHRDYRHGEGNSDSHVKATLVGSSVTLIVENGRLVLGTWQGIFFCEFDGPRSRQYVVCVQ